MLTPLKQLEIELEAIATEHGLPLKAILGNRRYDRLMPVRRAVYRHVLEHFNGNYARAGRFLNRNPSTIRQVINYTSRKARFNATEDVQHSNPTDNPG